MYGTDCIALVRNLTNLLMQAVLIDREFAHMV